MPQLCHYYPQNECAAQRLNVGGAQILSESQDRVYSSSRDEPENIPCKGAWGHSGDLRP